MTVAVAVREGARIQFVKDCVFVPVICHESSFATGFEPDEI
jgi:hypothetical protein